jgi:hypothetical protein
MRHSPVSILRAGRAADNAGCLAMCVQSTDVSVCGVLDSARPCMCDDSHGALGFFYACANASCGLSSSADEVVELVNSSCRMSSVASGAMLSLRFSSIIFGVDTHLIRLRAFVDR